MVHMKIVLSVLLAIAVIGCIYIGVTSAGVSRELKSAQAELSIVETQLAEVHTELADVNSKLAQLEVELTDTEAELARTADELTSAESALAETKFDLTDTRHQLDIASGKNTELLDNYSSLRQEIYQKLGNDEDSKLFITPDDPAVIAKVQEIAGAFSDESNERWRDYKRMYDWVVDNIEYSSDTGLPILPAAPDGLLQWMPEYWRTPAETLADRTGDCEDMANLLASLMLSYNNQQYAVWLIVIHNGDSGHVAVALPVAGDKLVIFDPAGNYYSGEKVGYVQSSTITSATLDWLLHWSDQMPGAYVTAVYTKDFYKEFSGTQGFIDWAIDQYNN
jgi:hypothetical protein